MSIGVWAPQGTVISTANGKAAGQPNVLYEANSIILHAGSPSTKVFKLWCSTATGGGINYFESDDGISWTAYGSNPIIADANNSYMRLYKTGGTYYIYVNLQAGPGTPIAVYTATDGVTFTLQNATALSPATQPWEGADIYPSGVIGKIGSTWYMAFASGPVGANSNYPMGVATSTDLINWTKYASNPVFDDGRISANAQFFNINGVYYGYSQGITLGLAISSNGLPTDIVRISASSPLGPWTKIATPVAYRTQSSEGIGSPKGELGDPCLVEALGNVYMYNTAKADGTVSGGAVINLQLATGTTIAQLITTYEGMLNVPIPGTGGFELNLVTAASDNFNRADANPIGGNWSPLLAIDPNQIVSNAVEGTVLATNCDSWWNPIIWDNDQWSAITITAISASSSVSADVRENKSGISTAYRGVAGGVSGSLPGTGVVDIIRVVSGTAAVLTSTSVPLAVGDVIATSAIMTTISVFQNRNLVGYVIDANIASGSPGLNVKAATSLANGILDNWSGGTFQAAPPISSFSPQAGAFLVGL